MALSDRHNEMHRTSMKEINQTISTRNALRKGKKGGPNQMPLRNMIREDSVLEVEEPILGKCQLPLKWICMQCHL